LTLDERRDECASRAFEEIAFPMSRDSAVTDFCRSLSNRNRVENLALSRLQPSAGARVSKGMLAPQVFEKTAAQDAATLHEQAAVDRFR
jgi:hypothetical protein